MRLWGSKKSKLAATNRRHGIVSNIMMLPKKFFRFRSIMFEMGVIYSFILALTLLLFSAVVYYIISDTLFLELDNEVRHKAEEVSSNINAYLAVKGHEPGALVYAAEKTISGDVKPLQRWWPTNFERNWIKRIEKQDLTEVYINFSIPGGATIAHSKETSAALLAIFMNSRELKNGKEEFFNTTYQWRQLRVINYPFEAQGQKYILQVGLSVKPVVGLIQNWMHRVFMSIPIIVILTSFMGFILARRIVRPVEKISAMANNISYEDLTKRVDSKSSYDEMESLVSAFNQMIERLEKSFHHIQNFSSAIAHELKTPLTIMRGETELALMDKRTPEEYEQTLNVILGEIKTMLQIIADLLLLTRVEHHVGVFEFEEIKFSEYFQEIFNQSKNLAVIKNIDLHLENTIKDRITIKADPLHLRRLFFNLIDNAIKFSPENTRIEVSVRYEDGHVLIAVKDYGLGIAQEDIQQIFNIFYTVNKRASGSGIGLGIAQSIVKAHGGKIEVTSQLGKGSTFLVTLPVSSHR